MDEFDEDPSAYEDEDEETIENVMEDEEVSVLTLDVATSAVNSTELVKPAQTLQTQQTVQSSESATQAVPQSDAVVPERNVTIEPTFDAVTQSYYATSDNYCHEINQCTTRIQRQLQQCQQQGKNKTVLLLLNIFVGGLGVNYFFTGWVGLGIAKLVTSIFTCGVASLVWNIVDVVLISKSDIFDSASNCWITQW